jgi:hypothetical protein
MGSSQFRTSVAKLVARYSDFTDNTKNVKFFLAGAQVENPFDDAHAA